MQKQTKMIKFMLVVLLLIPVILFVTGIIQTFVLKSKQNELESSKYQLEQSVQNEQELTEEYEYKTSDEYLNEYYKHNSGYGEDGDIKLN